MPGYRSLMADMLGLRFIATRGPIDEIDRRLAGPALDAGPIKPLARTPDAYIYENLNALPRALVAPEARQADFAAMLETGSWPQGFDPRRAVLLAKVPPRPGCAPLSQASVPPAAVIVAYQNTAVTIDVASPGCGYLVLNDAWQRWWTVSVNGEPGAVLRANVLFRAVAIPAGRSTVTFRFEPFKGLGRDLVDRASARLGPAGEALALWLSRISGP